MTIQGDVVTDGRRDFDFLHGRWRVASHRLTARLQGCKEWETFAATAECAPVIGGLGNVDHFHSVLATSDPFEGMSVRVFDPATGLWSIFWADNRVCQVGPPVSGRFVDGEGTFHGEEICNGDLVKVVFHWTGITPTAARWDQAFSADDGLTWETNWIMEFTRLENPS